MNRDLPHLVGTIFNTPHMIRGQKFDAILSAVGDRILHGGDVPPTGERIQARRSAASQPFDGGGYLADGGIAVLPCIGTLVRRGTWLDSFSGMTSYASLGNSVAEMLEAPATRGLMLDVDSFGGEASGCFDLVRFMVEASATSGKPIWAVVNENAASAGYAIASAADRIWVPTTGYVGSIGVVAAHVDVSKMDDKAGMKWTFVYAGERKLDGNSHVALSDAAEAALEADVQDLYGLFVDLVAENRVMSSADVRATEAGMYRGSKAIEVGLADDEGTFAEAMNAFAEHLDKQPIRSGPRRSTAAAVDKQRKIIMSKQSIARSAAKPTVTVDTSAEHQDAGTGAENGGEGDGEGEVEVLEQPTPPKPAEPASARAPKPPKAAAVALLPALAAPTAPAAQADQNAERVRCQGLTQLQAQATRLGVSFDASAAIGNGLSVDACRERVLNAAAERDEALVTTTGSTTHTQADANNKTTIRAGFDRAIERVAKRNGLAPRT